MSRSRRASRPAAPSAAAPAPRNPARDWRKLSPGVEIVRFEKCKHVYRAVHETYCVVVNLHEPTLIRCGAFGYQAQEGAVTVFEPGDVVRIENARRAAARSGFAVLVDRGRVRRALRAEPSRLAASRTAVVSPSLVTLLSRLVDGEPDADAAETTIDTAFPLLFEQAASARGNASSADATEWPSVLRAMELLHERLEETVELTELAHVTRLSTSYLCRVFERQVGLPPHAYQMALRIARARVLMTRGVTATRVAAELGFFDQSHFTRWFRRIVGTTPGTFASMFGAERTSQRTNDAIPPRTYP